MSRLQRNAPSGSRPARKRITSIGELKREARAGADFALLLQHGLFSRKTIAYDRAAKVFSIWNHIDDTEQALTEAELDDRNRTNIGWGIRKGAFVKLDEDPA